MMRWNIVGDGRVRHVWKGSNGQEIEICPTFYEDCGIPIDGDTGEDMEYVRTEILEEDE